MFLTEGSNRSAFGVAASASSNGSACNHGGSTQRSDGGAPAALNHPRDAGVAGQSAVTAPPNSAQNRSPSLGVPAVSTPPMLAWCASLSVASLSVKAIAIALARRLDDGADPPVSATAHAGV